MINNKKYQMLGKAKQEALMFKNQLCEHQKNLDEVSKKIKHCIDHIFAAEQEIKRLKKELSKIEGN